ncbi:MAG: 1-deoxy-D-xylulose-5-phosphate synthase [Bacteroidales bacterium]|nr:1-deoxy-D-xylulose-5-phosphate synthase [Bacteroidales bacterium]
MQSMEYELLKNINNPDDLRKLSIDQLLQVSKELRSYIIDIVSNNPGHFGASLGVVELTIALHYALNTPYDKIVWDVGHQAYGHKILTGRRDQFNTNRKLGGISGFPKPSESEYDAFGVGHASTSISAALGIAVAAKRSKENRKVVAVIGDGSMTGGLAFEGLNNAGSLNADLLVILNDNNMAIDPNTGALNEYLMDISTSKTYNRVKKDVWRILGKIPEARNIAQKIDNGIKSIILRHSNVFESFNFRYFGPVDGHDVVYLSKIIADLKNLPGPKVLHVITKKGKGFKQAELNQTQFHAPGKFDKVTGEIIKSKSDRPTPVKFQDVFGHTIVELAKQNEKIVGITPAMPSGSSLNIMMKEMPDRAFDVGIAEQHAVTFSAGLAISGQLPYCNIYSTFMQRAYDGVIHDVAIQNLNVVFCLDRGGLVGDDGETHHGAFDLSHMRTVPNLIVAAPMDVIDLRQMLYTVQTASYGPVAIRYPRGSGSIVDWKVPFEKIAFGKARLIAEGSRVAVLSIGITGELVKEAAEQLKADGIQFQHYDMRFVKPLDEEVMHHVCQSFLHIITVEDGAVQGGFGSAVLEFMAKHQYKNTIDTMGIPDKFIPHGSQSELYQLCGFDSNSIAEKVSSIW